MEGVQLLDLYFDTAYADTITSTMYTVIRSLCVGCQRGKLSQKQHECFVIIQERTIDTILRRDIESRGRGIRSHSMGTECETRKRRLFRTDRFL